MRSHPISSLRVNLLPGLLALPSGGTQWPGWVVKVTPAGALAHLAKPARGLGVPLRGSEHMVIWPGSAQISLAMLCVCVCV